MTPSTGLDVYFTVDVEIWCDGWTDLDRKFAAAFRRYVYGPTPHGDYGLPYVLRRLNDHGLAGTFFVEPLFAARFGGEPLAEVVELLRSAGQDVQLHLHTEWLDELSDPPLDMSAGKKQFLRQFDVVEQTLLIGHGRALLEQAGARDITAFRAGSFGFDAGTIAALSRCAIGIDASYNASRMGPSSGVASGTLLTDAADVEGVLELPMTVFVDGVGRLRHAQLTACSWREMEALLWQALERGQRAFVILSHNFELLNPAKTRRDDIVVRRFDRLCDFLDRHRDVFRVRTVGASPSIGGPQPPPLRAGPVATGQRLLEQAWRRAFA